MCKSWLHCCKILQEQPLHWIWGRATSCPCEWRRRQMCFECTGDCSIGSQRRSGDENYRRCYQVQHAQDSLQLWQSRLLVLLYITSRTSLVGLSFMWPLSISTFCSLWQCNIVILECLWWKFKFEELKFWGWWLPVLLIILFLFMILKSEKCWYMYGNKSASLTAIIAVPVLLRFLVHCSCQVTLTLYFILALAGWGKAHTSLWSTFFHVIWKVFGTFGDVVSISFHVTNILCLFFFWNQVMSTITVRLLCKNLFEDPVTTGLSTGWQRC